MSVFACPICDEPLTSPPPNYEAETAQAQAITGEPVVVEVVPARRIGLSARGRGGRAGTAETKPPKQGRGAYISTPCGHLFHVACIDEWFKTTSPRTCPTCRKPCAATKMVPIFPVIADNNRSTTDIQDQPSTSCGVASTRAQQVGNGVPVITIPNHNDAEDDGDGGSATDQDDYEELRQNHTTLMQDFEELQSRYNEEMDKALMNQAIVSSLESLCEEYKQEILALRNGSEAANQNDPTVNLTPALRGKGRQTTANATATASTSSNKAQPPRSPTPPASPEPKRARVLRTRKATGGPGASGA